MPKVTFETAEGEDVEIDSEDVVHMSAGEEDGTTVIELEDGQEITVIGTRPEVAAELEIDPFDYVDPEDDDDFLEGLIEDGDDEDG